MTPRHPGHGSTADRFGRRESLVKAGGLAVAVIAGSAVPATAAPSGSASGSLQCVLLPEMTQGPFYIPREKVRRDIREGERGVALGLRLGVVASSTCRPIPAAAVDVWHADAGGNYSGFQTDGSGSRTFLRGIQRTDAEGIARFETVYPGWYPGRAVHIHVKVHVGGRVVHTGQLFFDDALTDAVFTRSPYDARGPRDVRNREDAIFVQGGGRPIMHVRRQGTGYLGTVTMGVRQS